MAWFRNTETDFYYTVSFNFMNQNNLNQCVKACVI